MIQNKLYGRALKFELPRGQSAFLWGPRKCGKSTFLKANFKDSLRIDLLKTDSVFEYSKRPALLRERLLAMGDDPWLNRPIIIDEVQKVPQLLDEVHWLIEEKGLQFILCGSSARKLKKDHVNMLGGRAWRFEMFPLLAHEIDNFDLIIALNSGLIPSHYTSSNPRRSLKAYIQDYLIEEIRNEGLVRNFNAFSRFFDAVAFTNSEMVNYTNIASDCGVDSKTVREYFNILEDTLLGRFVYPFTKKTSRQLITKMPKFYLFDVGVANALRKRHVGELRGSEFGMSFEHFIFMELVAYRGYSEKDFEIRFWKTSTGLEVDFILGNGEVAIEVKGAANIEGSMLHGLKAFQADFKPAKSIVVCCESAPRKMGEMDVMPWKHFLEQLNNGKII